MNTNGVGGALGDALEDALGDGEGEGEAEASGDGADEVGAGDGECTTAAVLLVPHPAEATIKTSTAASRMSVS